MVWIYLVWVEVWVKNDNGISGIQVDTDTAGSRGQKVDEGIRSRFIEFVDTLLTERTWCVTILRKAVSEHRD